MVSSNPLQVLTWIGLSLLPVWVSVAPPLRLIGSRGAAADRSKAGVTTGRTKGQTNTQTVLTVARGGPGCTAQGYMDPLVHRGVLVVLEGRAGLDLRVDQEGHVGHPWELRVPGGTHTHVRMSPAPGETRRPVPLCPTASSPRSSPPPAVWRSRSAAGSL